MSFWSILKYLPSFDFSDKGVNCYCCRHRTHFQSHSNKLDFFTILDEKCFSIFLVGSVTQNVSYLLFIFATKEYIVMVVLTDDILILSQLGLFIETKDFFSKVIQTNFLLRNLNSLKFC